MCGSKDVSLGDLNYLDLTKLIWVSVTENSAGVAFHTSALDAAGRLWVSGGISFAQPDGAQAVNAKASYLDTLHLLMP